MKKTPFALAFLLLILLTFSSLKFSEGKKISIGISGKAVPELSSIDHAVTAFMSKWDIPGGSIALIREGKLVYSRGFGKANDSLPVLPGHQFRVASISKSITSVAVMKLVEQGKISLTQKVFGPKGILNDQKYLNISDKRIKDITVRHLLQHTSGWDRKTSPCGDPMFDAIRIAESMETSYPADPETVIRYMLSKPLDFKPGSRFAYSNFGYTVLGRIIEKITGQRYEEYVSNNIFAPAGISHIEMGKNFLADKKPTEVQYYDYNNKMAASVCDPGSEVCIPYGGFNLEAMDSHGGWIASAPDLAKFLLATDGKDKTDVLQMKTVKAMTEKSEAYSGYANGWFVNTEGTRWHTGCLPGASSLMAQLSNGTGWVILFNTYPGTASYSKELDKLMWNAIDQVEQWPRHDLFNM